MADLRDADGVWLLSGVVKAARVHTLEGTPLPDSGLHGQLISLGAVVGCIPRRAGPPILARWAKVSIPARFPANSTCGTAFIAGRSVLWRGPGELARFDRLSAQPDDPAQAGPAAERDNALGVLAEVLSRDSQQQVNLPTPAAIVSITALPEAAADLEAAYERALLRELAKVAELVPAHELAVQWDTCIELLLIEGWASSPGSTTSGMASGSG